MPRNKILFTLLFFLVAKGVSAQQESYKLIVFEGSDWCSNCIRFDRNVFSSEVFTEFILNQNISTEHIDFPQRKQLDDSTKTRNAAIAEKYKFKGLFPTILLVNVSADKTFELIYSNQNPEEFIALIRSKIDAD